MSSDSDPIKPHCNNRDDFITMVRDAAGSIRFKLFGLMFIMFILLSSDIFISRILGTFPGAVDHRTPTSWGTALQGLFLVLACIVVDAAIGQKII